MQTLLQDIRYGFRMLTKNLGVTAVAVLTLALGIGANAAIFSGVSAFTLRPLPVPDADRLVRPVEVADGRGFSDELSYPDFADYRDQATVFEAISAEDMLSVALESETESDVVWGQVVSGSYFDVMQIKPMMGRGFLPEEDKALGANPVVVISHGLWQRRFDSDPNIIGRTIRLSNRGYQVIGVTPPSFVGSKFALVMDFWAPMAMAEDLRRSPGLLASRDSHWMNVIARLKPGVSLKQASQEMQSIAGRLNQAYPNDRANNTLARVETEMDGRFGEATTVMKSAAAIAMALVGLILLIACANVANLMLARAAARSKEIGIRLALGASRVRLIRQLLTESLLLALLGGVFGLLLAFWVTELMQGFVPVLEYNIVENFFALDRRALVFTLIISLATGLIFGLAPAWHSSNPDVVPILKGDLTAGERWRGRRFSLRPALVVIQVALSLAVLVCGGLFIKSFRKAQTMDPGFGTKNALIVSLNPELVGYDAERSRNFFRQLIDRAASLPGVEAAATTRLLPLGDSSNSNGPILKEGETLERGSAGRSIMTTVISPGFFLAMQIPFIEGRDFDDRDQVNSPRVVIVNQEMAKMLWPGESAVGRRIFIGTESRDPYQVVGVVKTGKYRNLAEDPKPYFYYSMTQRRPGRMALVMRTNGDPRGLVGSIRKEVQNVDGSVPVSSVKTMDEHMTYALWAPNMAATFSLAFGVVAILLSAVGLYSVMAYVVSQRTREVGIRMALGANRADVLKMIAAQGMRLAVIGVVVGLLLSLALARALSSLLIGVSGYDVTTFVVVSSLLVLVALVACYLPARRATKIDPLVALRYE